jgi:hypothetical protein
MIAIIVIVLLCAGWLTYEAITAPTMDENGRVIKDPYHRCKR